MFSFLQEKWNVSKTKLVLILCVFAITGCTTAWLSRSVPGWLGIGADAHWGYRLGLRLFILVFGYQVVLLLVAFLLGQFPFFWMFEKKLLSRLGLLKKDKAGQREQT